jgi:CRP/FNR family transcriptional regulator, cyclic AMP receptor protein
MPLSTIERVLFLKGAELFHQIPAEDLVPVALVAQEVSFDTGDILIRQGDLGDCLYIIVDGEVSIVIRGVGAVAIRAAKSSIGEMGILSQRPRTADCIALTKLTALKIDRDDFWELLAEQPSLALGVIKALSFRLDEAISNLRKLSPHE